MERLTVHVYLNKTAERNLRKPRRETNEFFILSYFNFVFYFLFLFFLILVKRVSEMFLNILQNQLEDKRISRFSENAQLRWSLFPRENEWDVIFSCQLIIVFRDREPSFNNCLTKQILRSSREKYHLLPTRNQYSISGQSGVYFRSIKVDIGGNIH